MKLVSGDPLMAVDQIPGGYSVRMIQPPRIVAKITGKFTLGTSTFYTWEEVRALLDGSGYETMPGGQTGTNTTAYAAELNGSASVPNDTIVVLRPRVIADTSALASGGEVVALLEFEWTGNGGGTPGTIFSIDFITAISCVGGVITPTYSTVCIPGGYVCTTTTTTSSSTTTTTTSTTTTTTTPFPCNTSGTCEYTWNGTAWTQTANTCTMWCQCAYPPDFPGTYYGQTYTTNCGPL